MHKAQACQLYSADFAMVIGKDTRDVKWFSCQNYAFLTSVSIPNALILTGNSGAYFNKNAHNTSLREQKETSTIRKYCYLHTFQSNFLKNDQ